LFIRLFVAAYKLQVKSYKLKVVAIDDLQLLSCLFVYLLKVTVNL